MFKSFLMFIALILATAISLELSLRFIYFGKEALNPAKMNSYILLMDSDLVQPADNPDVYYELKPNLDTFFRGQHFVTNSAGLADEEYSISRPANTFRIAVVGSSWTMPTSVELQKAYHSLLEERLKGTSPGNVEFINFGVEYYGLGEMVATVRHKVLNYEPDMIIFAITSITPGILWEEHDQPFQKLDITPPFRQSYLYSALAPRLGYKGYVKTRRPRVKELRGTYMRQIQRAMEEIGDLVKDTDIKVAVIWLSYDKINESMVTTAESHTKKQGFMFIPINLQAAADEQKITGTLLTDDADRHPNETAHRLIADKLFQELWGRDTTHSKP